MSNSTMVLDLAQRLSGFMRGEALLLIHAKASGQDVAGPIQDAFENIPTVMVHVNKLREGLAPTGVEEEAYQQVLADCEQTGRLLYAARAK